MISPRVHSGQDIGDAFGLRNIADADFAQQPAILIYHHDTPRLGPLVFTDIEHDEIKLGIDGQNLAAQTGWKNWVTVGTEKIVPTILPIVDFLNQELVFTNDRIPGLLCFIQLGYHSFNLLRLQTNCAPLFQLRLRIIPFARGLGQLLVQIRIVLRQVVHLGIRSRQFALGGFQIFLRRSQSSLRLF